MNVEEIVNNVVELTQRPDKRLTIITHLNAIMNLLSSKADFYDDLVETTIAIDPTLYAQSISISSILTRFKKFKYLNRTGSKQYITPIGADKLLTPRGQVQPNKYYLAGTTLNFTLDQLSPTLEIGYYQYRQPLNALLDTNWMTEKIPYILIDLVTSRTLQGIGDVQGAGTYWQTGVTMFDAAVGDFAFGYVPGTL